MISAPFHCGAVLRGGSKTVNEIVDGVLFRAMHEALKPGQDYWKDRERDSRSHNPEQWDQARRKLAEVLELAKRGGTSPKREAPQ